MGTKDIEIESRNLNLWYGDAQALKDISIPIQKNMVTALIGPSGCGKSTFIRCINRMNDLIKGCRITGKVLFEGRDVYENDMDVVILRKRIGMVFQKPNPFPMSIYDNIAYGPRIHGTQAKHELDKVVEDSLKAAALWDEVGDILDKGRLPGAMALALPPTRP